MPINSLNGRAEELNGFCGPGKFLGEFEFQDEFRLERPAKGAQCSLRDSSSAFSSSILTSKCSIQQKVEKLEFFDLEHSGCNPESTEDSVEALGSLNHN